MKLKKMSVVNIYSMRNFLHLLFLICRQPFYILRLNQISSFARISTNCFIRNSKIGSYTYIARGVIINDSLIGNYCSIAPGSQIGAMNHNFGNVSTSTRLAAQTTTSSLIRTKIGHNVWIGANSIVMSGIKIGNGSIIGANSFVKSDVPAYTIVFGTPAKFYKNRFIKTEIDDIESTRFWEFKPNLAKEKILNLNL